MGSTEPLKAVGRFEWERWVRRIRMGKGTRYVALTMATYGDLDGARVRPGVERLAVVMEVSEKTVIRAYSDLRKFGLISLVKKGNRWAGKADEYRLTIPANILELPMLDPNDDASDSLGDTTTLQTLSAPVVDNSSPEDITTAQTA